MYLLPNFVAGRPGIVEHDFAGVVAHSKSTEWSEGDPVFGWIPLGHALQTREGALAEYVVVPDNCLGRRSPSIKPTEAAGIAVAAMTAYEALIVAAKLEEGQSVFINGGSTSVGIWAIQLAKAVGARVVVSGSEKNREFLTNLGIDEFVDYTQQPSLAVHLAKEPPTTKYNVFFETVGLPDPSLYTLSEKYLAPNGIFISVGPQFHSLREVGQLSRLILNIIWPRVLGGVKRRY
ncbi:hypothetical protein BC834DRAFT_875224 [Gloeopeniophorella convolvens]|nr:hypothetical protein BC834DRAFT_875224 [Gloeopeniophorella convolvens]